MKRTENSFDKSKRATIYPQQNIERKLGVDVIRKLIREECLSLPARELVEDMRVLVSFEEICAELEKVDEMCRVVDSGAAFSLTGITDTREWMLHLKTEGAYIEEKELDELRRVLKVASDVKDFFDDEDNSFPRLESLCSEITDVKSISRAIDKILSPTGEIKDNASVALSELRRRINSIQSRINGAIKRVMSRAIDEGIVEPDAKPAVRDGRLVIPVIAMNKRRISGIVHDESSTGRTFYIEPMEVVELNNEQRNLEIEERKEIIKILVETANVIRPSIPDLITTFGVLYQIDFITSKAKFALKTGGHLPRLVPYSIVEWRNACHPVLKLNFEEKGKEVVPLNIELTEKTARILVISGPNAGGKSVALKTVGVNQYIAQCGILPVMDSNSLVGVYTGIFVDLGDDQSLEDDLSTYSSHLRNMKFMLSHGDDRTMILIDEFGTGTEPQIGGAIAQSLLSEFNRKGMWGVITTHYQNLKQFAQQTVGIVNGSMVYDRQKMEPTFQMVMGNPGSSFAVEIALRTGLPKYVIDNAESIVGSDYFNLDKYLLDINRDRRYWENKRNDIKRREKHLEEIIDKYERNAEKLRVERRTIIQEAKDEAVSIINKSNTFIEKTIRDIREAQAQKEETKQLRKQLVEEGKNILLQDSPENKVLARAPRQKKKKDIKQKDEQPDIINLNDNVLLDGQGQPGKVLEINKDKAVVSFGQMKMAVPLDRLKRTLRKSSSKPGEGVSTVSSQTVDASRQRQLAFKNEIDVRGMRADEAIQAVTYFIDDALQFNAGRVRILHGTGTGALRMAIRQYLASLAGVSSFHDEDVRFGGAGITVVNL